MKQKIIFEDINPNCESQAQAYALWTTDELMINNWTRQNPEIPNREYTIDTFKKDYSLQNNKYEKYAFMMKVNDTYIGYGQIIINHPVALIKTKKVSWPSIAIGDSNFRTKGYGKIICQKIYELSKLHNCEVIEAGVFEFNIQMKEILIKNGFKLIGTQEKVTFAFGKWQNSEHYLLEI